MGREFSRSGTLRRMELLFWELWSDGVPVQVAAERCEVSATAARTWVRRRGGVRPRHLVVAGAGTRSRALSEAEREEIALGLASGRSLREIARQLGRAPSTISREGAPRGVGVGPGAGAVVAGDRPPARGGALDDQPGGRP